MNCPKCIAIEKRKELYYNFFHKIYKVMQNFDSSNEDKLKCIMNHIKDTMILHGEINVLYDNTNALFHKHTNTDQ